MTPKRIFSLAPEFITPQDGHQKLDCEAAAKCWMDQHGKHYRGRQVTLPGDDLYSRQPLCEHVIAAGLNFLFACKPQSHATLTEWLDGLNVETLTI